MKPHYRGICSWWIEYLVTLHHMNNKHSRNFKKRNRKNHNFRKFGEWNAHIFVHYKIYTHKISFVKYHGVKKMCAELQFTIRFLFRKIKNVTYVFFRGSWRHCSKRVIRFYFLIKINKEIVVFDCNFIFKKKTHLINSRCEVKSLFGILIVISIYFWTFITEELP